MIGKVPKNLMKASPFPVSMKKRLIFQYNAFQQAAAPYHVGDFVINSWKPDGTNKYSGFTELAAIYNLYKVTSCRVRYNVAANEPTLPCSFGLVFRDLPPSGSIGSYAQAVNALEVAPTTGIDLVGETTGQSLFRSRWYKIRPGAIIGNELEYLTSPAYAALTTAAPADSVYMSVVVISGASGTDLTNGIYFQLTLESTITFYSTYVVEV